MRQAVIDRKTSETQIQLRLDLDGGEEIRITSGIGYLDHLLTLLAFHAGWNLELTASGDLDVDDHHTVEDVGIGLGRALAQALGERRGIARYGFALVPMDEVLVRCVIDLSGRSYLRFAVQFEREMIGQLATENIEEFFRAFCRESGSTLHLEVLSRGNAHHQAEALFKALGRSLRQACALTDSDSIPSTKGSLD